MKKLLSLVAAMSAFTAFAQLPVSTDPENKKVILEEYTGIYCGYCPDGHSLANQIHDADPDNVVLINIHTGPFAAVAQGEPDLTSYAGAQIAGMGGMGIKGYPAGDMNRLLFATGSQTTNGMAGNRDAWAGWASIVKAEAAYCNVGLEGFIDTSSAALSTCNGCIGILTVNTEVYYTDNSPVNSNSLSIVLMEDSIRGPQHNYGNPYYNLANYNADGTYNHNHVLRAMITPGNYGTKISNTTSGTTFAATYSYAIPPSYGATGKETYPNLNQMHIAGFVTETYKKTVNGNHGTLAYKQSIFTGVKNNSATISSVSLFPNPATDAAKVRVNAANADNVSVKVYNQVGQLVYESASKELSKGTTDFEINTQSWSAGLYNVLVVGQQGTIAKKLNVVK